MDNAREGVDLLKAMIRKFPGVLIGVHRQVGKTQAIMELIHEDCAGRAQVCCINARLADIMKDRYRSMYPNDSQPQFIVRSEQSRGGGRKIFADDWFDLTSQDRRQYLASPDLACRIGTEFGTRDDLEPEVIRFTEEELSCLESMLEVLVEGSGTYSMLRLPELVKLHSGLLRKFKSALREATGVDRG